MDDLNRAPEIARDLGKLLGPHYTATSWQEQNLHLFDAVRGERVVTIIIIGLIELVAALNILIVLVMMVMEKYRDIAVLMSMGARRQQIRAIFMLQGVLIGVVGSVIGLTLGYTLCYFAEKYRWIRIDESVYAFSYVPFETALGARHLDRRRRHSDQLSRDLVSRAQRHADCAGGGAAVRVG